MNLRSVIKKLKDLFSNSLFNVKWKCLNCGKEIFEEKAFCEKCYEKLPFNDKIICAYCGRQVVAPENYCTTCKGKLTSLDCCRSFFVYEKPISTLIMRFKYGNHKYLVDYFADCLSKIYFKYYFNADFFVYVPMTAKSEKKRGYNQAKLLAEKLSQLTEVPVIQCIEKVKETKRQATLNREQRLKNLKDAFRVIDKKVVKGKSIVIVDDVTTTGATANYIAVRLKKAGAKNVSLITVASTPPIDRY